MSERLTACLPNWFIEGGGWGVGGGQNFDKNKIQLYEKIGMLISAVNIFAALLVKIP